MQNLFSITPAVLSSVLLYFIVRYPGRVVFFTALGIWILLVVLFEWKIRKINKKEKSLLPIILITIFSFLSLVSIVEWVFLEYLFVFLVGFVMLLLFQSLFSEDSFLQIEQKPYRRIIVVIWSFDVFAIMTTIFALDVFFPSIPFWFLTIVGGAVFSFASIMIWKMYFHLKRQQWLVWAFLIGLLMIELIWVMQFLPFGYLVTGFFLTWLWYVLQLLTRFHFGPNGVVWKRQFWFLSINLAIFVILLMFFVRWV